MANYIKKGDKKVETSRLISSLKANSDLGYANNYWNLFDLSDNEKINLNNIVLDYIQGFLNGELSFDDNGVILDSTNQRRNAAGTNDPNGRVAKYINDVFDKSTAYIDPADKNKIKYDASKGIATAVNRALFNSDNFNNDFILLDAYDELLLKRLHTNRALLLIGALLNLNLGNTYLDLSDSDTLNIQNGINTLISKLQDGDLSEADRMYMSNLGLHPDLYFYNKKDLTSLLPEEQLEDPYKGMSEDEKAMAIMAKLQLDKKIHDARTAMELYTLYSSLPLSNWNWALSPGNVGLKANLGPHNWNRRISILAGPDGKSGPVATFLLLLNSNEIYNILSNQELLNKLYDESPFLGKNWNLKISGKDHGSLFKGMTNSEVLSLLLGYMSSNDYTWSAPRTQNNHYAIGNGSNDGMVLMFDPTSRRVYETNVTGLDTDVMKRVRPLLAPYVDYMMNLSTQLPEVQSEKNGGIIKKMLFGSELTFNAKTSTDYANEAKEKEKNRLESKATKRGKTVEQVKRDELKLSKGLSATDITRLSAIAGDLASLGLSVSGVGSVASAVPGVMATLANTGADIADGASVGSVLTGLGTGLAMDVLGMVPIVGVSGKLLKTAKLLLKTIKASPYLISAATTIGDENVRNSIGKVLRGDWNNLTHEDGRNLAHFVSFASGTAKLGVAKGKTAFAKKLAEKDVSKNASLITDKGTIKVGDETGLISKAKFDELRNSKSLEEANKLLKDLKIAGFEDAALTGTLRGRLPFVKLKVNKGNFVEEESKIYDFTALRKAKKAGHLKWLSRQDLKSLIEAERMLPRLLLIPGFGDYVRGFRKKYGNNRTLQLSLLGLLPVPAPAPVAKPLAPPAKKGEANKGTGVTRDHLSSLLGIYTPEVQNVQSYIWRNGVLKRDLEMARVKNRAGNTIRFIHLPTTKTKRLDKETIAYLDKEIPNWRTLYFDKHNLNYILNLSKFDAAFGGKNRNASKVIVDNKGNVYWWKYGGLINKAQKIINSFKNGGNIPKFQSGGWFDNLYTQKSLNGWNNTLSQSNIGGTANNSKHYNAGDLTTVYNVNQAYTSNRNNVSLDLNYYYNNYANNMSALDFVNFYNTNAGKIRNHWENNQTYGAKTAGEHNRLFKLMFNSRSGNGTADWDIGYDENSEDIEGSSTWLRRMDRYEKTWDNLTDQERANRVHKVGNFYVYKENNGDINVLDNAEAERLLNLNPNTSFDANAYVAATRAKIFTTPSSNGTSETTPVDDMKSAKLSDLDTSLYDRYDLYNRLSKLRRLSDASKTNNKSHEVNIDAYSNPALMLPKSWESNVHGSATTLNALEQQAATTENIGKNIDTSDPSLKAAAWLDAHNRADELRLKAKLQDDATYDKTALEAKLRSEKSMESGIDTTNTNNLIILKAREMTAKVDSDFLIKQSEARTNYLIEQEQDRFLKMSDIRTHALNLSEKIAALNYEAEVRATKDAYERKLRELELAGDTTTDITTLPEYLNYKDVVENASVNRLNTLNNIMSKFLGITPFTFKNTNWTFKQ